MGLGWDALDPTYNEVTPGSVAPSGGSSVAAMATGSNKRMVTASGSNSPGSPAPGAGSSAPSGSFVGGLLVFVVLVLIIMVIAHKFGGDDGDFKNIKASAYNVIFVALVATTGIPVIKVAMYKLADWNVPGAASALQWAKAA